MGSIGIKQFSRYDGDKVWIKIDADFENFDVVTKSFKLFCYNVSWWMIEKVTKEAPSVWNKVM